MARGNEDQGPLSISGAYELACSLRAKKLEKEAAKPKKWASVDTRRKPIVGGRRSPDRPVVDIRVKRQSPDHVLFEEGL